nr:hypothetical protein [Tanacetum cinerariifolium]
MELDWLRILHYGHIRRYHSIFGSPVATLSVFISDNHKRNSFASNRLATLSWTSIETSSRPSYRPATFVGPISTLRVYMDKLLHLLYKNYSNFTLNFDMTYRLALMKTKRKLVPKSTVVSNSAGSGQGNAVAQDGYDNVCGVGPTVPPKRQCVRQSSSLLCRAQQSHVGPSVSPNRQHVPRLSYVPCRGQGLQMSGF